MKLQKTNNPIYNDFFSKSNLTVKIEKTKWRGKPSENSFCFINPEVKFKTRDKEVLKKLKEVFEIQSNSFDEKYLMAISGDGQEVKRITTLHSSSLAALLLLYSIKDKTLNCTLNDTKYIFNDCFFEVKTNVKGSHFSNMDIVLVGKDSDDKDVIFFLESKFSEYLNTGMCNNISIDAYKQKYDKLGLLNQNAIQGLSFKENTNENCLQIKSETPQYCAGIKQMISHYLGVTNFIEKGAEALDPKQKHMHIYKEPFDRLSELQKNGANIILGEVLFAFDDIVDKKDNNGETKYSKYTKLYKELAILLENKKNSKLIILPEVITYQELLKDFKLDKKVQAFYQL